MRIFEQVKELFAGNAPIKWGAVFSRNAQTGNATASTMNPGEHRGQRGKTAFSRLRQRGVLTPDAGRSRLAEEYRLIKRPLIANAFGQGGHVALPNGNMIMVTSSLPQEGKSFTAVNLAISLASELENTVLLIDADVARLDMGSSGVMKYLGLKAGRGLIDVLIDPSIPLSEVLIKTEIDKLTVLPAGKGVPHATELLASAAMQAFVDDISKRYHDRIVVFDTPSLLSTSEAAVLASYMGQVVLVVEAEKTPQGAVTESLSYLRDCAYVGMVLNKAPSRAGVGVGDYFGSDDAENGR